MTTGGAGGRMVVGGVAGATAAAWNSRNYNDPNVRIGNIMKGAVGGAIAGGATRLVTPAIRWGKKGALTTGIPVGLKMGVKALGMGGSAVAFAARNPGLTGAAVFGVGALYAGSNVAGTQTSSLNYNLDERFPANAASGDAALGMMNNGVSPMGNMATGAMVRSQRMASSTVGLTQGLHRGRHG